jgi:hypothetical protein
MDLKSLKENEEAKRTQILNGCPDMYYSTIRDFTKTENFEKWFYTKVLTIRDDYLAYWSKFRDLKLKSIREEVGELSPENIHKHFEASLVFDMIPRNIVEACKTILDDPLFFTDEKLNKHIQERMPSEFLEWIEIYKKESDSIKVDEQAKVCRVRVSDLRDDISLRNSLKNNNKTTNE